MHNIDDARKLNLRTATIRPSSRRAQLIIRSITQPRCSDTPLRDWLMCSPGFIKSTARGFGLGVETRRLIFFRARYNPCRCEAVIRAAVIRPWTLELHPTDETDYSSYQINLCLLSLAGLRPLFLPLSLYSLSRLSRLYTRTHSIRAR